MASTDQAQAEGRSTPARSQYLYILRDTGHGFAGLSGDAPCPSSEKRGSSRVPRFFCPVSLTRVPRSAVPAADGMTVAQERSSEGGSRTRSRKSLRVNARAAMFRRWESYRPIRYCRHECRSRIGSASSARRSGALGSTFLFPATASRRVASGFGATDSNARSMQLRGEGAAAVMAESWA